MIQIKNIHKYYGTGESRNEVLKGISLQVEDGDFVVLSGASGSGKSTLLNVMSGLERAYEGTICYEDTHELSGGEQQRVSVARALAKKPRILYLDEPTGALDEETGRLVLDYISKLQKESGFTVIMVTHNQNVAEMANTVIRMNSGRIVETYQNADGFLPAFSVHFHPVLCFLLELKRSNVRQRKSLIFFITFAVFCFSSMMQMSFSMDEPSSRMIAVMIMAIGIVLACVTLFLASTSVVKANGKTITMMKVFGYQSADCAKSVLSGYHPWAYLGFVLGSAYQYLLLKIMVSVVFADIENMPEYHFDFPAFLITLFCFVVLYESVMYCYMKKMEKLSVKEIMLE